MSENDDGKRIRKVYNDIGGYRGSNAGYYAHSVQSFSLERNKTPDLCDDIEHMNFGAAANPDETFSREALNYDNSRNPKTVEARFTRDDGKYCKDSWFACHATDYNGLD